MSGDSKPCLICFRITKDDRRKLEKASRKSNMGISEYLRVMIFAENGGPGSMGLPVFTTRYDIIEEGEI